jgi:hypothetical protein
MSADITIRDISQSRLLCTPKCCEKSVLFNVERYSYTRNHYSRETVTN